METSIAQNANISVAISDDFMLAVERDATWNLVFPDTVHPDYNVKWTGDLKTWLEADLPIKIHKTIKARHLWDAITESAWVNGEPGVWFVDKANEMSNSYYLERLRCTNPCFEEPLPDWGVCCLGSLNLPQFITPDRNTMMWKELNDAISVSVRFLDDVIEVTPYIEDEIAHKQKSQRRIGLGTMGLAETLIRLGLRYGSTASLKFIDKLYGFIATSAYTVSAMLAQEKGACSAYDAEKLLASAFMKQLPSATCKLVEKYGIRNMAILTQAPTGTTATMVGTSTGIEPFFDFQYTRKSQLGVLEEYVKVYAEWKEENKPSKELPDYFVTARDILPEEHVAVQAAVQRWVDASISKTINLPHDTSVEKIATVFKSLYTSGCKGGTVYRDGSRSEQVLNRQTSTDDVMVSNGIRELPYKREGVTVSIKTPSGTAHITMNSDVEARPLEVFVEIGKAGSAIKAMAEAMGRLISLSLRITETEPCERVRLITDQLCGIGGRSEVGFGKERIKSLPDAIGKVMREVFMGIEVERDEHDFGLTRTPTSEVDSTAVENLSDNNDLCPMCGMTTFVFAEGCSHCIFCGYSEC